LHGSIGREQILPVKIRCGGARNADAFTRRIRTDDSAYVCAAITVMLFGNEHKMTVWVIG
jgi:hypothetical protein